MNALFIKYILPVLALIGALLTALFVGKSKEKAKNLEKQNIEKQVAVKAAADKQVEIIKGANDVKNDINKLEPDIAADKSRSFWLQWFQRRFPARL